MRCPFVTHSGSAWLLLRSHFSSRTWSLCSVSRFDRCKLIQISSKMVQSIDKISAHRLVENFWRNIHCFLKILVWFKTEDWHSEFLWLFERNLWPPIVHQILFRFDLKSWNSGAWVDSKGIGCQIFKDGWAKSRSSSNLIYYHKYNYY